LTPFFKQLQLGPMANFVYLIGDAQAGECAVVDPGWDAAAILREAKDGGVRITRVLLTHGHSDHTNGVNGVLAQVKEARVHIHPEDALALRGLPEGVELTPDGTEIQVGGLRLRALHTPGHTPGSQCFLCEGRLMTGDTLFVGECGRVDLPGSDPAKLYHSLRRIASLPDSIVIYPGHDYGNQRSVVLGEERSRNPYIQASLRASLEDFCSLVTS
jgi:glyoxylase-like metal-dependent hydrolase (beta-lactamase superfamily II)